ncbi:MAG: S-layer homology domain-containing protein [Acidimicrobiia bacterium]|nr:S-layer homology domain-containing protein [Acidimicrobiia bacterium]
MSAPTARLVDRAAGLLANRFGRRGFLAGTAVAGSALATNPLAYALQPVDAYRAICNCSGSSCPCGSLCCDGYTEFCCTLTGHNTCPAGTILGGWWKVDGTAFCGGPRYYMDCNTPCGGCGCGANGICSGACSGTPCGCANGSCNNRKAGCTEFRYGQCNQQIACIGPIVCRVVTCVPPWALDATCTTTVRVDNNTANHDRPCLHVPIGNVDTITETITTSGRQVRIQGWGLDFDVVDPVPIDVRVDGALVSSVIADRPRPDVANAFVGWGDRRGFDVTISVGGVVPRQVCVTARNVGFGSQNADLGCTTTFNRAIGTIDEATGGAGTLRVRGWAVLNGFSGAVDVRILANGAHVATARANLSRPDVGAAFPQYGSNRGFDVTVTGLDPGTRTVCAEIVSTSAQGNALLACTTATVGGVAGFSDVSVNNPFADDVVWLVGASVAGGYPDGTFRPTAPVSRQAMAAFLQRLAGLLGAAAPGPAPAFDDVGPQDPFFTEIGWLAATGIAQGFPDGTFRAAEAVSRQAMAAFLQRFWPWVSDEEIPASTSPFSDVGPDHPFAAEIAWLAGSGIAQGFADGTFRPGAPVSRQAMAAFLHRLHERAAP